MIQNKKLEKLKCEKLVYWYNWLSFDEYSRIYKAAIKSAISKRNEINNMAFNRIFERRIAEAVNRKKRILDLRNVGGHG